MNKVIGVTKIAQMLNDKQILTPTKYKQSQGINFKNQGKNIEYWTESTVSKILKNETYIGNLVQGYNKKVSYKSKKMKNQPKNDNLNKAKLLENKAILLSKEMENINKAIKELYLNKVSGKVPEEVFEDLNSSFLSDKSAKQKELTKLENDLSNLKEKELNSKFIKEQKEKTIDHFKNFTELNYDIVNSFIDYIEIGEKNKKSKSQDVIIHWNF